MDAAAKATGSFGAILIPIRGRTPAVPISASMRPAMDAYFRDGWAQRDERYRCLPTFMRNGVATDFDFTTRKRWRVTPIIRSFFSPHGLRWFAGVRVGDGEDVGARLAAQRGTRPTSSRRAPAAGPLVACHLRRSRVGARSSFGFARLETALGAFEASGTAVAMIDRLGEVVRLNASAERLLGPDLQIACRRIVSWRCDATRALDPRCANFSGRGVLKHFSQRWSCRGEAAAQLSPTLAPFDLSFEAFAFCQGFVVFVD